MSQLNVDIITGRDGQAAPEFTKGAIITGVVTATTLNQNVTGDVVISNNLKATGITTSTGGFVGNVTGNVTGNVSGSSGSSTGNAATATALQNARTIGGVSFDGTSNINLPGVNAAGNQDTSGTAAGLTGTPAIVVGDITAAAATFSGNVSIAKTLTYEDVKNIDSVGIVTAREGVFIPDTKELRLGNTAGSPDVKLYSTGTNGWIYTPISGADLYMGTNSGEVYIQTGSGGNDTAIKVNSGGSVEINHSTNKKFETTNDGTVTTGIATATSVEDSKGDVRNIPRNNQGSAYTLVAGDAGKCITAAGNITVDNSVFSVGNAVSIIADTGSAITIVQGSGVTMYNAADGSTGNRTLAARGMCNIWFVAASNCYISGAGLS